MSGRVRSIEAGEDDRVRGLVARIKLLGYHSKRALLLIARGWNFDDALLAAEEERVHDALELGKKIGKRWSKEQVIN